MADDVATRVLRRLLKHYRDISGPHLCGAVPANLPPFPTHLPPVRLPKEAHPQAGGSNSPSPQQPSISPSSSVSAAAVVDLQSQLRDTQSYLTSHLDKVRALEGALTEQETVKREVSLMVKESRREMEAQAAAHAEPPRCECNCTPPLHHEQHEEHEHDEGCTEAEVDAEAEEQEKRRAENLGVGRPRTPEPTRMGLRDADSYSYPARASLLGSGPRWSSMTSPLSHVSLSELRGTDDEGRTMSMSRGRSFRSKEKESLVEVMAEWEKAREDGHAADDTRQPAAAADPASERCIIPGGSGSREEGEGDDVDTDATLVSSTEDDVVGGSKHGIALEKMEAEVDAERRRSRRGGRRRIWAWADPKCPSLRGWGSSDPMFNALR
ncbi:hypothetical protein BDZ97DRAFT_1955559 [Flammula alnicola]|nr:hypothetical protein BDZ97DRAFT_1955559 [Flammula alnicola]